MSHTRSVCWGQSHCSSCFVDIKCYDLILPGKCVLWAAVPIKSIMYATKTKIIQYQEHCFEVQNLAKSTSDIIFLQNLHNEVQCHVHVATSPGPLLAFQAHTNSCCHVCWKSWNGAWRQGQQYSTKLGDVHVWTYVVSRKS